MQPELAALLAATETLVFGSDSQGGIQDWDHRVAFDRALLAYQQTGRAKLEADTRALWSYRVLVQACRLARVFTSWIGYSETELYREAKRLFPELPESVRQELGPDPDTQRGGR